MGHAIPKLQYKNVDTTGNILTTSATISNIPSTADVEVGMFVRATGIPDGATVASKTSTTVVLTAPKVASATTVGVTLAFGYEILFDYPPIEDTGETKETKASISESLSGRQQVSVNYIEANRKLKFSFLPNTLYLSVVDFLEDSALLGDDFRYFDDKTTTTYVTYSLDSLKVTPKKITSRGTSYIWEVPLSFRRVL